MCAKCAYVCVLLLDPGLAILPSAGYMNKMRLLAFQVFFPSRRVGPLTRYVLRTPSSSSVEDALPAGSRGFFNLSTETGQGGAG